MDSIFESVFGDIHAFVYRCRNDSDYTMEYMTNGVERITGYAKADILHNAGVSYVGLTPEIDRDRIFGEVDAAIEVGKSWDITHRLVHRRGHHIWVRERGTAIFEGGEPPHLQGLVVGAEAEADLRTSLEQRIADVETTSANIVGLTKRITGAVRALSMLSINARIEAARTGPAGQGFAVVANEIKTLADQNAGFADQITDQVRNMGH